MLWIQQSRLPFSQPEGGRVEVLQRVQTAETVLADRVHASAQVAPQRFRILGSRHPACHSDDGDPLI